MEEGLAVRVRLPDDTTLPRPPRFLAVGLTRTDVSVERLLTGDETEETVSVSALEDEFAIFDGRRETVVRVPGPGTYAVMWTVGDGASPGARSEGRFPHPLDAQRVQVSKDPTSRELDVAPHRSYRHYLGSD
jgi:hypothetical protein